jgi:hypothetical protein
VSSTGDGADDNERDSDRLCGLSRQEIAACLIAERDIGATAKAWDVSGRRGVVDAVLTLADGRTAAFEVTNLAAAGALQAASLLARDNHTWEAPGQWWWDIQIGSAQDIQRLKQCYKSIILTCEAAGVSDPEVLGWAPNASSDLRWLVQRSSSSLRGHPSVSLSTMKRPGVMVVSLMGGGAVDDSLSGFSNALQTAFDKAPHIASHLEKLANADGDERHLFIALHDSALPFPLTSVLMFDEHLPSEPPPLPERISHLWLAPSYSRRVLVWCREAGWRNAYPYDN